MYPTLSTYTFVVVLLIVMATFTGWVLLSYAVMALYLFMALATMSTSFDIVKVFGWLVCAPSFTLDSTDVVEKRPSYPSKSTYGATEHDSLMGGEDGESMPFSTPGPSSGGSSSRSTRERGCSADSSADTSKGRDMTLVEALRTPELWLLFVCFMCGVSAGITVLDNMDQIVNSKSSKADDESHSSLKTAAVALFSAVNSASRVTYGMVTDSCRNYLSRSSFLALNLLLMCGAMVFWIYADVGTVYTATCVTAIAYGGMWMLVPALVADVFGSLNYGSIQGFMLLAACLGSEVFYNYMSVHILEAYADDGGNCYDDSRCFEPTFIVLASMCGAAALLAVLLARKQHVVEESLQRQRLLAGVIEDSSSSPFVDPHTTEDDPGLDSDFNESFHESTVEGGKVVVDI